jgi:hypothetical protein
LPFASLNFAISIFQSKDDPEIGFRFQYKVILKMEQEDALQRPVSFLVFWVCYEETGVIVASGGGKGGNLVLVFPFSMAAKLGGGNVEISRLLRDFQGTVERTGKLLLLFRSFHGPVISTALSFGSGLHGDAGIFKRYTWCPQSDPSDVSRDSLLTRRSNSTLAAVIFRAHPVSLVRPAIWSSCAKLTLAFRCRSAFSIPFSFSYGVA